jgi:hypothetical protein
MEVIKWYNCDKEVDFIDEDGECAKEQLCQVCGGYIEDVRYDGFELDEILICSDCHHNAMADFVFEQWYIFKKWLKDWVKQ